MSAETSFDPQNDFSLTAGPVSEIAATEDPFTMETAFRILQEAQKKIQHERRSQKEVIDRIRQEFDSRLRSAAESRQRIEARMEEREKAFQEELSRLQARHAEELRQVRLNAEAEKAHLERQFRDMRDREARRLAEAVGQLKERDDRTKAMAAETRDWQERTRRAGVEIGRLRIAHGALIEKNREWEKASTALRERIEGLRRERDGLKARFQAASKEFVEQRSRLMGELTRTSRRVQAVEAEMRRSRTDFETRVRAFEEERSRLGAEMARFQAEIESRNDQIRVLTEEKNALGARISEMVDRVARAEFLEERAKAESIRGDLVRQQMETLREKLEQYRAKCHYLEEELEKKMFLQHKLDRAERLIEDLESRLPRRYGRRRDFIED